MGVSTSEVGYTSATARRGDHESSYEHVVVLGGKKKIAWHNMEASFVLITLLSYTVIRSL